MPQLIILVAMFALLWVIVIMPGRRRAQAQRQLVASVEVGDEILTVGGLYGRVDGVSGDDELLVEIAPDTQVRVARRAVAAVMPSEDEQPQLDAAVSEQNEQARS